MKHVVKICKVAKLALRSETCVDPSVAFARSSASSGLERLIQASLRGAKEIKGVRPTLSKFAFVVCRLEVPFLHIAAILPIDGCATA